MNNENPLVSIIIPVYNGSNYLAKAIDSALAQTYTNIEILVINDGSNDDNKTRKIATSYGTKIRYFEKENGGVSTALNMGIKNANGFYISWLSHDDEYTNDKIEKQVYILKKQNENKLIAYCDSAVINLNSEIIKISKNANISLNSTENRKVIFSKEMIEMMLKKGVINGCSLLIPKSTFLECGMFSEDLRYAQDMLMWMKICFANYSFIYDKSVGVLSRRHSGQLSQTGKSIYHKDALKMSKLLIPNLLSLSTKEKNLIYYYIIYSAKIGDFKVVRNCYSEAKALLSYKQKVNINFMVFYGKIRPFIRWIYYKLKFKF